MKRHIFFREATASFVRPGRQNKLSVYVCVCLWLVNYAKIRIAAFLYGHNLTYPVIIIKLNRL